jgi:hypothetical protein
VRLPHPLYEAVSDAFAGYAVWHLARRPEFAYLRRRGSVLDGLRGADEPGGGAEFLRFHRAMIRGYRWIEERATGGAYRIAAWDGLPPWVAGAFDDQLGPAYLEAAYAEIGRLVDAGSADELGAFLTADRAGGLPGIVRLAHGTISDIEAADTPGRDRQDADIGHPATAPGNAHFWALYGWVDDLFAEWQRRHGEAVDRSPTPPVRTAVDHLAILVALGAQLQRGLDALPRYPSVFDD